MPGVLPAVAQFPGDRREALARLRRQLGEKVQWAGEALERDTFATGIEVLDETLGGGLPRGALTEVVAAPDSRGAQSLLVQVIRAARRERQFVALIDALDRFDPATAGAEALPHLLWVRCQEAAQALQAADLLMRDENFPVLLVDLRDASAQALRQAHATLWYRLQRVGAQHGSVCLVFTPRPMVPSAELRLELSNASLGLASLEQPPGAVHAQLEAQVLRSRQAGGQSSQFAAG